MAKSWITSSVPVVLRIFGGTVRGRQVKSVRLRHPIGNTFPNNKWSGKFSNNSISNSYRKIKYQDLLECMGECRPRSLYSNFTRNWNNISRKRKKESFGNLWITIAILAIGLLGFVVWAHRYEYSDFRKVEFDFYIIPQNELDINSFRLLDADNRAALPINT